MKYSRVSAENVLHPPAQDLQFDLSYSRVRCFFPCDALIACCFFAFCGVDRRIALAFRGQDQRALLPARSICLFLRRLS